MYSVSVKRDRDLKFDNIKERNVLISAKKKLTRHASKDKTPTNNSHILTRK
jgi:hypothetical protein